MSVSALSAVFSPSEVSPAMSKKLHVGPSEKTGTLFVLPSVLYWGSRLWVKTSRLYKQNQRHSAAGGVWQLHPCFRFNVFGIR